jgi:aspartyl protease family protein
MKPMSLVWLAALAGLLALCAPREHGLTLTGHDEVTAAAPAHAPQATIAWLGDRTVLDRQADGHFYADAEVAGMPVHFLVDTGASVIALTADDAASAGLEWTDDDLRYVGQGASGAIYGVPVTLDDVSLGGFRGEGVEAVIVPRGLTVSLLGQSFLSRVPKLDIAGDKMTLGGAE